ncbi:hypothetical protein DERF_001866 [Dermatophagoides farinae]|uniref:Pyrroline-5-carboxylate reductase n=1 Tax=Dermatophagoides farinae TaxID=6954 RepID=A0A922LBI5_DERFA|nr:pyrroline-5-carboxylate reductase 1, mitochondrial-like [Dermatophagoides farinae]KAH7636654.1 pyrroline-5-carboxylate reductase 2-like [Dermatophagoides farinae]KAH9527877.1 hypothetical protein DERF_001866 [Dermatophagoides farinae]
MLIGFIGSGKIAQALIKGFTSAGICRVESILASAPKEDYTNHYKTRDIGCRTTYENKDVLKHSDIVILAVKPPIVPQVLADISSFVTPKHLMISIAAGIKSNSIEKLLPEQSKVVRVMPNTPVLIKQGASVFSLGRNAQKSDGDVVKKLFESVGICDQVPENLIDACTALSGSGPAYTYMFLEAMADAGVLQGLSRELSYNLAAHTLIGAAKMVLETKKHPAGLKDDVCSPSGCTINAMYSLEKNGFRTVLMDAVGVATEVARKDEQ